MSKEEILLLLLQLDTLNSRRDRGLCKRILELFQKDQRNEE